jgi:hypothetical protein
MADPAPDPERPTLASRVGGWLKERAYQMTRDRCPWCKSTPVHSIAEMVVYTNKGYRFPTIGMTYCLICEQLLDARLIETDEPPCTCDSHIESDIAEADTLGIKNPHRITDIVFSSCSTCGQILGAQVHY